MFIDVSNLKKSYTTGVIKTDVLKGIEMKLGKGEIGVILGPSGSGKSTLMNIIGGVDRGDSGKVIVDGIEVNKLNNDELTEYRREDIGFVFQFYNLVPNLTVGENIEVVSNISKSPLKIDEVLEAVEMLDKKHRFPRELSGGEQQRVSIAERIKERSVDLLVCHVPDLTPALVIQVEPPSADGKRKYRGERFMRQAMQAAGIAYLNVNPNQLPEPEEIKRLLAQEDVQA
jgi:putative ABC transport system ATP-binding protein